MNIFHHYFSHINVNYGVLTYLFAKYVLRSFPKDIKLRQKWIDAVARRNWQWKEHHRICGRHFTDDCFINIDHKWSRLKLNAVPSLHLKDYSHYIEYGSTASAIATPSRLIIASTPPTATSTSRFNTSAPFTVTSSPTLSQQELISRISQLEQELEKQKIVSKRRLLKMNALRQMTKRLKSKNLYLKLTLEHYLDKEKIEEGNFPLFHSVNIIET